MHYFNEGLGHYFYKNIGAGEVFILSISMNVKYDVFINYFLGHHSKIATNFIIIAKEENKRETILRHKIDAKNDNDITRYEGISYEIAYEKCKLLDEIHNVKIFTSTLKEEYSYMKKENKECSELEERLNEMTRDEVLQYKLEHYRSPLCHESFDLPKEQIIKQIVLSKHIFDTSFRVADNKIQEDN